MRPPRLIAFALVLFCSAVSHRAHAQQVVLVDAVYTHSKDTTDDSHYYVDPPAITPANWTSPVNYVDGAIYVRLEVKTKPSAAATRFQVCFDSHPDYTCTLQSDPYTATTTPDAITWATTFAQLWSPGSADWKQGISGINLILKDTNNVKPSPEAVGDATSAMYMPTDLRVTVTLVAAGATYEPPATEIADAAVGGAGDDAAVIGDTDAGPAVDAGASTAGNGGSAGVPAAGSGSGAAAAGSGAAGAVSGVAMPQAGVGDMPMDQASKNSDGSCSVVALTPRSRGTGMLPAWLLLLAVLGVCGRMPRLARRWRGTRAERPHDTRISALARASARGERRVRATGE